MDMYSYGILINCFGTVYKKILKLKNKIDTSQVIVDIVQSASREFATQVIDMKEFLTNKLNNGYIVNKFVYALCCLYDHIITNIALQKSLERAIIANMWNSISLEVQIFQTSCAGQKLFQDLDDILKYDNHEIRNEMLKIYLNIINLYDTMKGVHEKVKTYRANICKILYSHNYDLNLFECINISNGICSAKQNYFKLITPILLITYNIVTAMIWSHNINPIHNKVDSIISEL